MSREKLKYLSTSTIDELYAGIYENVDRYRSGGFHDMIDLGGWDLQLSLEVDLEPLKELNPDRSAQSDIENSLLVWRALHELTPALACEDRIWTRLSHVECLEFSRQRWVTKADSAGIAKEVRDHFFAPGMTACRDDHSVSRLWWNAYIAKNIRPNDQRNVLQLMLKTADIRSNFVERTWSVSRPRVADAILRMMEREEWVTSAEKNYREFMKSMNRRGGGVVFELMPDQDLDRFMDECAMLAKST